MSETNLRQSEAKAEIEGVVSEISLEKALKDGKDVIKGSIVVKTSDTNFVRINTYANKITKDGRENSVYTGLTTVMNEYKSIAKDGEEEADIIRVVADLNPYTNPQTGKYAMGYRSNFFNRLTREPDYKAEFKVELFIQALTPEIANGEETGRGILKGWMPTYDGIEPVELIITEDMYDEAEGYFEPGSTFNLWGDIIANQVREEKEIAGGFGKSHKEVKVSFKNELIVTGASEPYEEDVTPNAPYDEGAIKLAIQEWKDSRAEAAKPEVKKKPSGAASGRSLTF